MGQQQSFAGAAEGTTASTAIGSGDMTIAVAATTNWPDTTYGPFVVTISRGESDEEKVLIASYTTTLLTVADGGRGYDDTTAQTHEGSSTIECTIDAAWHQDVSNLLYDGTTSRFPTAASTVTGPDDFGADAVVGTSAEYARADHDHGLPASDAPEVATTVTGPDAFGASAVVGTSTEYARADHDHGLPVLLTTVSPPGDAAYDAAVGEMVLMSVNNGYTVPVNLPAPSAGAVVGVKKTDSYANNVLNILPPSGTTLDGKSSAVGLNLYGQHAGYLLISDGTDWFVSAVIASVWTAFTPTWSTAGTAPSLGNGTLSGGFQQVGNTIHYTFLFRAGSTTTFGTGAWSFGGFPGDPAGSGGSFMAALIACAGTQYNGAMESGEETVVLYTPTSTSNGALVSVTDTVPGTWAANSSNNITSGGFYQTE